MYILIAILVFGFLILIHEAGHYVAARIFHVKVYEFSIGMGPRLVSYTSKKTGIEYGLRAIPLGGFVSMEGELSVPEEQEKASEPEEKAEEPSNAQRAADTAPGQADAGALAEKPAWQRLIVHAAGAAMNLLFGFLAALILTTIQPIGGTTVADFDVKIENAEVHSWEQGLQAGDTILRVNGKRVYISDQLSYEITHQGGEEEPLKLTVLRDGEEIELLVSFPKQASQGITFGICDFRVYREEKTVGSVVKHTFHKSCYLMTMVWESLIDLVTGKYSFSAVSGPVGTATVISDAAKNYGPDMVLYLAALISVNLGIFNLLPLPALDGGHIFYTLCELITRRRLPPKVIGVIDLVGLFLLLGLMVVVTFKDIFALF